MKRQSKRGQIGFLDLQTGRALPIAMTLILLVCPLFPFVATSEIPMLSAPDGRLVASGFEFFFACLVDSFLFLGWIVSIVTGQGAGTATFPFEFINLAPVAELLSIVICVLSALGRKPSRALLAVSVGSLATVFHSTFAMDMYYFDSFLPASWIWAGACAVVAGIGISRKAEVRKTVSDFGEQPELR